MYLTIICVFLNNETIYLPMQNGKVTNDILTSLCKMARSPFSNKIFTTLPLKRSNDEWFFGNSRITFPAILQVKISMDGFYPDWSWIVHSLLNFKTTIWYFSSGFDFRPTSDSDRLDLCLMVRSGPVLVSILESKLVFIYKLWFK